MSYTDAVGYLYGLQKHGIKLGLGKTEKILSLLGSPQRDFRSLHIAGTNGKGSVSAMIASILSSRGLKVGLFTSPHLVSFTERIMINGRQIPESEVVGLTEELRSKLSNPDAQDLAPTFFEFVTAMAFIYFSRNHVDFAVVETGMGGRLDATNTITPEVSVVTRISYDHREFLGSTLTDIAKEKAGIIKRGIPVVCAQQEHEAEEVIRTEAEAKGSPLSLYGKDFSGTLKGSGLKGTSFSYHHGAQTIPGLHTPLAGEHQLINACLAVEASLRAAPLISASELREGLAATRWHGRLELASENPPIMIDGAHNPDAAQTLSGFIKKYLSDYRLILVTGIMSDKDIWGILSPLLPLASQVIFTAPNYGRAATPAKLVEYASAKGFHDVRSAPSVREAISLAKGMCGPEGLILITGSFYTIGEALEALGEKAVLGALRETL